jgi:hypothetical protein
MKELLREIVVPYRQRAMRRELLSLVDRYNEHRPHTTLQGRTPNEAYLRKSHGNRRPRIEPRPHWPRGSPCALPKVLVAGQPGDQFDFELAHFDGRTHLPIVTVRRRAA